ncbi:thioredoxin domain-containing protein [Pelosinus sp. sgz500959]|uniref:thioredoxin domain-containing protein n=1 Tax=Pelosinus sp. sgz500959 TaxID=3242472 RepID=UPI00366E3BA8
MDKKPNRLIKEKSPYLLQHAYNPVDWHPWGDEAFEKAKREDKPVFFSSGYSCCHWCHVMERESFEDEEVAAVLNEYFVCIKVDREERPDVDGIYMSVCQAMTGQGGWPLTVVMTPDKKPFFAGTYFPKHSKMGRMGLIDLVFTIEKGWESNRDEILRTGEDIVELLQNSKGVKEKSTLSKDVLDQAYSQLAERFDPRYGGFGKAPKFPTPHNLMFLLRYWKHFGEQKALTMVEITLTAMGQGGIYDHLGYGFARYSTDQKWLAPHFEKMLYDNALLCQTYLEAYQCTGNAEFARIAEEILTYVLRDMTDLKGGFYSAEDADSEGVEGKFYVFTREEVLKILGETQGTIFADCYHVSSQGNFEHGTNILNRIEHDVREDAKRANMSVEELEDLLVKGRETLYQVRETRIHPYKDDKILTAWNALMISTFAKASKVLTSYHYAEIAEKGLAFIYENLMQSDGRFDGRLLARYREGEAAHLAYLDDYAFLLMAVIDLYEATFQSNYLEQAVKLAENMEKLFWDAKQGGFYFYGNDGEKLITRPKELYDGAIPSGNSVAALALQKLADLTHDEHLAKIGKEQLEFFVGEAAQYAAGYTYFMMALDYYLVGKIEVVIVGAKDAIDTQNMLQVMKKSFLPAGVVHFYESDGERQDEYKIIDGKATAYLCKSFACQPPITDMEKLAHLVSS